jgi:hypothetical protein
MAVKSRPSLPVRYPELMVEDTGVDIASLSGVNHLISGEAPPQEVRDARPLQPRRDCITAAVPVPASAGSIRRGTWPDRNITIPLFQSRCIAG